MLAHELRSPVAAIAAIAAAFPAAPAAQRHRLLELAAAACRNVERLLEDAEVASVRSRPFDVGGLAVDAAEAATLSGARVLVATEPSLTVDGDPERLRQALDNLIENALGHAPPGSPVRIAATRGEGVVRLSVSDDGDGIDAADTERIFEAGTRLTDARPGSGLGLAVVLAIVEAHGGRVEVESAPGQGATFTLVLPQASSARA